VPNALCGEMTDGGTLSELGAIVPQPLQRGHYVPREVPGHGLELNTEYLAAHRVEV